MVHETRRVEIWAVGGGGGGGVAGREPVCGRNGTRQSRHYGTRDVSQAKRIGIVLLPRLLPSLSVLALGLLNLVIGAGTAVLTGLFLVPLVRSLLDGELKGSHGGRSARAGCGRFADADQEVSCRRPGLQGKEKGGKRRTEKGAANTKKTLGEG